MPSEPPVWDRKEVLKDRKQERGAACDAVGGAGGVSGGTCSTSRWRESYHGLRDNPRASPRLPFAGHHGHDVGYHQLYPEEPSAHGCTPSRSGDRFWPEEEIFRPSSGRYCGGGKSNGNGVKESQESSRRSPCLDSVGDFARQDYLLPVTAQRSVAIPITHAASSPSSPMPSKNLFNKIDGGVIDGMGTGQRCNRDHSLGSIAWKPLKWTRPSLPSSKAVRSEAEDANLEISPQLKDSPARSPVPPHLPLDDKTPSKKPRLGWGQGLAKYEKQKVEESVDASGHNGSAKSANSAKDAISDSSLKVSVLPGSMSPATPTSATCSSSLAGMNEKVFIRDINAEADKTQYCDSFSFGSHNSPENSFINLDQLDASSLSTLALLLTDLMQPEDACSGDSSFSRNSAINKLLLLKKDISKELEKTESEIDSFENNLKSINCDGYRIDPEAAVTLHPIKSIDTSLSEVPTSNNCMLASPVFVEQHALHPPLCEENAFSVNGTNHISSGVILSNDPQIAYLETESHIPCNIPCDVCPANIKDPNTQFPDAKPLMQPSIDLSSNVDDNLIVFIMNSNMDAAKRASEEFDHAMLSDMPKFKISESYLLQCKKNFMHIRGKLAMNKHILKFKERVLALKFRALHHLWSEDLSLLTLRKHRPKSIKRNEVISRSSHAALQKYRSSIRSRFTLPAGNLTLVPTTEMINFTGKLLLDSQMRHYRNNLKMPAQIIDEHDRRYSRFNSNNGLIENPTALEKERMMMNPWMQEEKEIFLEMLATFGKDFKKISSFLSHKTTADCIEFYYKNHKSDNFAEVKRQLKWRKHLQNQHSNTYLMTSITRFNREANAASLDLLGAASMIATENNCNKRSSQKQYGKSGYHDTKISRRGVGFLEKAYREISGSEREVAAADVLAGICGALSSDAMSSCVTSSIDPPEMMHFTANDRSLTPEATCTINEEDSCSDESSDELESSDWTDGEKSMFIRALNMYGKDFVKIAHFVRTRSRNQCKIFYSKARKCLGLDVIQPLFINGVTQLSDANGGRSDTDDACAAEIDSAICSTQSCSKIDLDFTQSMLKTCNEGHTHTDKTAQQADPNGGCEQYEISVSIQDDIEGMIDSKDLILNEDKLAIDGANLKLEKGQGEIGCSEIEHDHEAIELFVDTKIDNEKMAEMFSSGKPADKLLGQSKLLSQASEEEAAHIVSCGNSLSNLSKGLDSNQLACVEDPAIENRAHAKHEESANAGDSFFFGPKSHSNDKSSDDGEQKNDECCSPVLSPNVQRQVPLGLLYSLQKRLQIKDGSELKQESVSRDICENLLKIASPNQSDPLPVSKDCFEQQVIQSHEGLKFHHKTKIENSSLDDMPSLTSQSICSFVTGSSHDRHLGAGFDSGSHISMAIRKSDTCRTTYLQGHGSSESDEQSQRGGDLKLFGQILTYPSSQDVSIMPLSPKQNANATTSSSSSWKDAAIFASSSGRNGLSHHQSELPQRSYGFWDGNRIQTGFSSLPESAIILAKYQASLTGMPFSLANEGVANGNADYSQQSQTHSPSTEKFLGTCLEFSKRNSFDLLSDFQQQGKLHYSDPVAGLQMHYSGSRSKILNSDLESLMGDTGGR